MERTKVQSVVGLTGEFAQIGQNSVVLNRDIPPYAIVVGNPGRVIKIWDKQVDPDDYKNYKYDPSDYHGPPPGIVPDELD